MMLTTISCHFNETSSTDVDLCCIAQQFNIQGLHGAVHFVAIQSLNTLFLPML